VAEYMRTRMGHVQEGAGSISLNAHVLRTSEPGERDERAGLGDLCLVVVCATSAPWACEERKAHTVRRKVCDAANGVTLDLDVRAEHLPDERLQTAKLYDKKLVLGCGSRLSARDSENTTLDALFTARLPRAALAARWTSVS
jgi:hypothetical protein